MAPNSLRFSFISSLLWFFGRVVLSDVQIRLYDDWLRNLLAKVCNFFNRGCTRYEISCCVQRVCVCFKCDKDSATILSIRTTVSLTFDASSWRRLANAATICSLRQYEIATSIASISYKPHTNAPAICSPDQIAAVSSEIMCLLLPRFGALQVCLLYTAVEHEHEIGSCVIVELTAGTSKDNR